MNVPRWCYNLRFLCWLKLNHLIGSLSISYYYTGPTLVQFYVEFDQWIMIIIIIIHRLMLVIDKDTLMLPWCFPQAISKHSCNHHYSFTILVRFALYVDVAYNTFKFNVFFLLSIIFHKSIQDKKNYIFFFLSVNGGYLIVFAFEVDGLNPYLRK